MQLPLLSGNREPYEPQDMLLIFKDNGTADIASVTEINDERLFAESATARYAIPVDEYQSYVGRKGRIFITGATVEAAADYQRIAALERSTVLRQITHFQDEGGVPGRLPLGKLLLIGGAVLLLIIMMAVR